MKNLKTIFTHSSTLSILPLACFVLIALILGKSAVFEDVENRWQSFFYDLKFVLPLDDSLEIPAIYLIELDDASLPNNSCRSPVNKQWLAAVISAIEEQNPSKVGINFVLEFDETSLDQNLRKEIADQDNIVLLNDPRNPVQKAYLDVAYSYGSMAYLTDSSGSVRYVCADAVRCGCEGLKDCPSNSVFFLELIKNQIDIDFDKIPINDLGWLKLNLPFYPSEANTLIGSKPFTRLSAHQLLDLEPGVLTPEAIFILGKEFKGLHQRYQVAAHLLATSGVESNYMKLSANELVTAVSIMTLTQSFITKVPLWMALFTLTAILLIIFQISKKKEPLAPFWIGILIVIIWNISAALLFAVYSLEVISIIPTIIILSYAIYQIRTIQTREKIRKLALTNELAIEKYSHLVDKFHTHSVFNALDNIRYLIRTKNEIAEKYLIKYSSILLGDLHHDPKQNYPLIEQWQYVKEYLDLLNLKNENAIAMRFEVNDALLSLMEEIKIPWKLFYPLVENAAKYSKTLIGRESDKSAEICIQLSLESNRLRFTIENTYFDFESVHGAGKGLSNLRNRLDILFPEEESLLFSEGKAGRWKSILTIPINNEIKALK